MLDPETVRGGLLSLPVHEGDRYQGSLDAAVRLVFYGDYQCPTSAQVNALLQTIQHQEPSFCLVFRHFPQPHYPHAQRAAEAAGSQGKFWAMHERLFQHQDALDNGNLVEYAIKIGLEEMQFLQELAGHIYIAKIQESYQSGVQSGVEQAPACFINRVRYRGTWNQNTLMKALIEAKEHLP